MNTIVISCSSRKIDKPLCKAIDLYNSNRYRVLRKYNNGKFKIFILSAKYGLIESGKIISNYDLKMDINIAKSFKESISIKPKEFTGKVYCIMYDLYFSCFDNIRDDSFIQIKGPPGVVSKKLKNLLLKGEL